MERNLINNRTLVSLSASEWCVELRTVNFERKSSRFLINRSTLKRWLENEPYNASRFFDSYLHSFVSISGILGISPESCGGLQFKISWLRSNSGNLLEGYVERFRLPFQPVLEAVRSGEPSKVLSLRDDLLEKSKIVLAPSAHERVARMSKRERRAFSKAMRDHWHWQGSTIELFSETKDSFFFRERRIDGTVGICGGLILSTRTFNAHKGLIYEQHT